MSSKYVLKSDLFCFLNNHCQFHNTVDQRRVTENDEEIFPTVATVTEHLTKC